MDALNLAKSKFGKHLIKTQRADLWYNSFEKTKFSFIFITAKPRKAKRGLGKVTFTFFQERHIIGEIEETKLYIPAGKIAKKLTLKE